jgi:hypothetical protein
VILTSWPGRSRRTTYAPARLSRPLAPAPPCAVQPLCVQAIHAARLCWRAPRRARRRCRIRRVVCTRTHSRLSARSARFVRQPVQPVALLRRAPAPRRAWRARRAPRAPRVRSRCLARLRHAAPGPPPPRSPRAARCTRLERAAVRAACGGSSPARRSATKLSSRRALHPVRHRNSRACMRSCAAARCNIRCTLRACARGDAQPAPGGAMRQSRGEAASCRALRSAPRPHRVRRGLRAALSHAHRGVAGGGAS